MINTSLPKKKLLLIVIFLCLSVVIIFSTIKKFHSENSPSPVDYLSHLHVEEIREGKGPAAVESSTVRIHYTEWIMAGGKLIDSSYQRGFPSEFSLNSKNVILGLKSGILGMKQGGKRKLIIPPAEAYGEKGTPNVPPNSHLIFEIELLNLMPESTQSKHN